MRLSTKSLLALTAFALLSRPVAAASPAPILILDLSSYTAGASFAAPVRNGLDMVEEEVNARGGVLGRPIHFEHVDDTGAPEKALTKLQSLVGENPVAITGCNLENIALAISSFAKRNKMLHIYACAGSDEAVWQEGHRYAFRGTGPLLYSFNKMMAERAATKKRLKWAAVNQSYAWGQSNLSAFKTHLAAYQPDAKWVEEQWNPVGRIDAGSVVNAILRSGADAVYTSLWGSDLTQFLREATKRGLTKKAVIVGDNIGRPEFIDQIKGELPEGMITIETQPLEHPVTPEMKAFAERYESKYHQSVRYVAMLSYMSGNMIASAIEKAGTTDTETLADKMPGMELSSVYGPVTIRAIDHVPTNGVWVGETALKDGKPILVNVEYKDGKDYVPPDAYIQKLRAAAPSKN